MRAAIALRFVLSGLVLAVLSGPAPASTSASGPAFSSTERLMQWTFTYRDHPRPRRLPDAVRAMVRLGLLEDEEKTGYFVGFIAGVLNANPRNAPGLIARMLPLPPKEQGVLVRAIGYSHLPNWPALMVRFAPRMAERQILIDEFLAGVQPDLLTAAIQSRSDVFALWGYYIATGDPRPIRRVIQALAWTGGGDPNPFSWARIRDSFGWESDAEKQTRLDRAIIGSTAKWTLVSYAEHHRELVDLYRAELPAQPDAVRPGLQEVLVAAERFEAERVRTEEAAVLDEMKQRIARTGSSGSRAAYAGSVGIATGCVIAGALGHPEIAVPCAVTGALYSGALKIFEW